MNARRCFRACTVALLWLTLAGCAGQTAYRQGRALLDRGHPEEALVALEKASQEAPENREYRIHYLNARAQVVARLLLDAQRERQAGHFDEAEALYRRVLRIEPDNEQALAGLPGIEQERRHERLLAEAGALMAAGEAEAAERNLLLVLRDNPRQAAALALRQQIEERAHRNEPMPPALRKAFEKQVSLEFREAPLKQVLEALSLHAGLNFVLDKDVPPGQPVTLFLHQVSVADALDVMLSTNQLRRRILNDTTLLIYPDTSAKQSDHQDLMVKNFFLANAEAKQVMTMLKTVLKAKNVFADDKLNLLIMRDTPAMIRLAERMVSIQDVGEPEVMLELEVLEVQRSRLLNLGIQLPEQLTLSPLPSAGSTNLTLRDLQRLSAGRTGAAISDTVINLQNTLNNSNLLANPRIRTHNREKAVIRIGDRVPIITTTATSTGFVSENVQYVDVGLKLEVEPVIFPNDEISIKLALEVSSVSKEIVSKAGSISYQISGRNAATVLRLKDGETQILGGLINKQDIQAANRFPGLGDLPVLGRLFSSQKDSNDRTELVLSITPRLVRGLAPPLQVPGEFWSGTENDPRLNLLTLSSPAPETPTGVPAASPEAAAGPALSWQGPTEVAAGHTFKLSLRLASPQALTSVPLQIAFDPTVFELVAFQPGKFMGQDGAMVETLQPLDGTAGSLSLTQTRSGDAGASGEGELVELELRALRPAPASLIEARPGRFRGVGEAAPQQPGTVPVRIGVTP